MALYRRFKPENTYREWLVKVIRDAMTLPLENEAIEVHIVNDQYWKCSTKNDTRLARGDGEISYMVHVKSVDQKMLKGKDWNDFFYNGENKEDLIQMIKRCHLQSFFWLDCIHGVIAELDPENYGWCVRGGDGQLQPVWFTGYQLPQSLRKINRSKVRTGIFSRSVNNINEPSDGAN